MIFINIDPRTSETNDTPIGHVVLSVPTLLYKVRENRELIIEKYNKALAEYKEAYLSKLKEIIREFKKDFNNATMHIPIAPPSNDVREFDLLIAKLENSLSDYIALTDSEFDLYFLGNSDISRQLDRLTQTYSLSKKSR